MECNSCASATKKYVVDSSFGFGTGLPEVKPFPYWILLFAPLLLIPLVKKK